MALFGNLDLDLGKVGGVKGGIDSLDCRKKRQEQAVQIRKNKREDNLRKRRMTGTIAPPAEPTASDGAASSAVSIPSDLGQLPRMLEAVRSASADERLGGVRALRKLLSRPTDPPVREVIDAGFLPYLCEFLKAFDSPSLQFEAAWALTNVGSSDLTKAILDVGSLPLLVPLLKAEDASVREQAAWCLGNVAGDCCEFRDMVLNEPGAVEGLLLNLQNPANLSMMRNVTWAVSNLCRGSKPKPNLALVRPLVPVLARIVESCGDDETIVDAAWALSYVSDGEDERLDAIVETGICPTLVKLLHTGRDSSSKVIPPCLRTLGNVVTGTDVHTQAAIDAGLLRELVPLFQESKASIRKEAAWTASNVTAGTRDQIGAFLAVPGLPESIVEALSSGEWQVRKEAAWAVANIFTGGSSEHVQCIVERHDALRPLCDVLRTSSENKIIVVALSAIEAALAVDAERYTVLIEEYDGLEAIEDLQSHSSNEVYRKAHEIMETHFADQEEDEEEFADGPLMDEDATNFTFDKPAVADTFSQPQAIPSTGFNFSFN